MSARLTTKKQSASGYLRVHTQDFRSKMDHPSPISRLGTPMSLPCEGSRPSLGWSFMAGSASHQSRPSSVASFVSSQEPHTPPQHAIPMEFTINPNGSFENFSVPARAKLLHESQVLQSSFNNHPGPEWSYMQRPIDTTLHRMPFNSSESMIPTTGDYHPALGAGLQHPSHVSADQQGMAGHPYFNAWSSPQLVATYSNTEGAMPFEWQQSMHTLASTILPSDVIRDQDIFNQESNLHDYQECHSETHSPRGEYYAISHDDIESHNKSEPSLSEQGDETWTPGSGMMTPEFGIKKDRRSATRDRRMAGSKRRSRVPKSTTFNTRLHGRDMEVNVQQLRNSKKHACRHMLENGQLCHGAFERVEHLRRHEQIHQPTRPFMCPLHLRPEYKCHKVFGRRDNWRDHLRTHISSTTAGRNDRISFEIMFELLRELEEPEEAEKTINMLLKWKAKGGHEKIMNMSVRAP